MRTIILDLEMNISKQREIIEIAAVKLNEANEVIAEYSRYVRPVFFEVTKATTKLTGITPNDVNKADTLEGVLKDFLEWVGDEEAVIYSWSMSDYLQVKKECEEKEIEIDGMENILDHWKDYQREFGNLISYNGQLSLKHALNAVDFSFEGVQHSALTDAKNTAVLYNVAHDPSKSKTLNSIKEWFMPKEVTMSIGDLFPQLMVNWGM